MCLDTATRLATVQLRLSCFVRWKRLDQTCRIGSKVSRRLEPEPVRVAERRKISLGAGTFEAAKTEEVARDRTVIEPMEIAQIEEAEAGDPVVAAVAGEEEEEDVEVIETSQCRRF
jgi:hypothetical protein